MNRSFRPGSRVIAVGAIVGVVLAGGATALPAAAAEGSGSLAIGVASGAGAIDPQTGQLSFGASLGQVPGVGASATAIAVSYNQNAAPDAGLGPGLSWGFPRVIDSGASFLTDGRVFGVDASATSGLRGYLLQDVLFVTHEPALEPGSAGCAGSVPCAYTASYYDGTVDAFDARGLLSSRADRHGNTATFTWDAAERLESVAGGYPGLPVSAQISYSGSDGVQISFPERSDGVVPVAQLALTDGRLTTVTDTAERQTQLGWTEETLDGASTWLLSQWQTSSGARSSVTYSSYGGGVWAVSTLATTDVHTGQPLAPTVAVSLDPSGSGRNYTGYPTHNTTPPPTSGTTDGLVASNDRSYLYSTSVSDGVTTTVRTFNWLHQTVSVVNSQRIDGDESAISTIEMTYPQPEANWPDVPAAYLSPVSTSMVITDPATKSSRTVNTEAEYDALGRVVSQTQDGVQQVTCYDTGQTEVIAAPPSGCPTPDEGRGFGQPLQKTATAVADTTQVQQQVIGLTGDRKDPAVITGYSAGTKISESALTWTAQGEAVSTQNTAVGSSGSEVQTHAVAYSVEDGTRVVALTDPAGGVTRTTIDGASGLVMSMTASDGVALSRTYDAGGRITVSTQPTAELTYEYSQAGLDGSGVNATTITRKADGYASKIVTDALGRDLESYDNQVGGAVSSTWRQLSASSYDERGNVASRTDQAGLVTTYGYDTGTGLLTSLAFPDGRSAEYSYDAGAGTVSATMKDTNGDAVYTHTRATDDAGRLVTQESSFQDGTPTQSTSYEYTAFGMEQSTSDSVSGLDTAFDLDESGSPVSATTTGADADATATYDTSPWGRTLQQSLTLSDGGQTSSPSYEYDSAGQQSSRTDQTGQLEQFVTDAASRLVTKTEPDGRVKHLAYDATTGNPTRTWWTAPDAPTTVLQDTSYSYDPVTGKVASAWYTDDQSASSVSYAYYPDGSLKSIVYPGGATLGYTYDEAGRMTALSDPVGTTTSYTYEQDSGRLSSAAQLGAAVTYAYDSRGNIASAARTLNSAAVGTTTYGWDDASRLLSTTSTDASGAAVESRAYTWDANDKIASVTTTLGEDVPLPATGPFAGQRETTTEYAYDGYGRLVEERVLSSSNDVLSATTYTLGADSGVSAVQTTVGSATSTQTFQTDAAGRHTGIESTSTVGTSSDTAITWDASGRQLTDAAGNAYTYTPDGRLAGWSSAEGEKTALTWRADGSLGTQTNPDGSTVTSYQLPGAETQIIAQVSTTDGVTTASSSLLGHVREAVVTGAATGSSVGENGTETAATRSLGSCDPTPTASPSSTPDAPTTDPQTLSAQWLLTSHRGDVTTVLDTGGAPVSHTDYSGFGQLVGSATASPSGATPPFGFTGALTWDTGLVQLGARTYDPVLTQFSNKDGVSAANLYLYAQADPISYVDPTGHLPKWFQEAAHIAGLALAAAGLVALTAGALLATGETVALVVTAAVVNSVSLLMSVAPQLVPHYDKTVNAKARTWISWITVGLSVVGAILGGAEGGIGVGDWLAQRSATDAAEAMAASRGYSTRALQALRYIDYDKDGVAFAESYRAGIYGRAPNPVPWSPGEGRLTFDPNVLTVKYDWEEETPRLLRAAHVRMTNAQALREWAAIRIPSIVDTVPAADPGYAEVKRTADAVLARWRTEMSDIVEKYRNAGRAISKAINDVENPGFWRPRAFVDPDDPARIIFTDDVFAPKDGKW